MAIYGYARVSTKKQSIERQITNIVRAYPEIPDRNIYREKETGTSIEKRDEFTRLIRRLRSNDTVVFDSVSRFSREAEAGFNLYEDLFNKGVNLVFLKEPYINTENFRKAMSVSLPEVENDCLKPMMDGIQKTLMLLAKEQFKQAFEQSEKEVKDLSQRTKEGMQAKGAAEKIRQSKLGKSPVTKKSVKAKEQIRKYSKDFNGSMPDTDLIKLVGCSRNTFYKYKRELKHQISNKKA